jgi:hypothetical protein
MIYHSTMTKPKELILKVIIVVTEKYLEKVTIMRMILPSDCNVQLYTPKG